MVALDDAGAALRPALLWMDMRSAPQAAKVAASGDAALAVNGGGAGPVSAEWMVPKALWLKEQEPEVFDRAAVICEYQVGGGAGALGVLGAPGRTRAERRACNAHRVPCVVCPRPPLHRTSSTST